MVNNYEKALEDVVSLGCERILTSGLESSALEGTPTIKKCIELVSRANKHIYISCIYLLRAIKVTAWTLNVFGQKVFNIFFFV